MSQIQSAVHKPQPCQSAPENGVKSKGRILLVEDHDVNQILIKAMTSRLGYESELAADGTEAVKLVDQSMTQANPFDLVLMDIQMPLMDGYEATRMIRASGISETDLPIIALTANAFDEDIRNCLAAGMQAHIAKPIDISNLDSTLQHWLDSKRSDENGQSLQEADNCFSEDLVHRYQLRKSQAINSISSLLRRGTFTGAEIREVSDQMHKLAGTAAMFGEKNLGTCAKQIEDGLRQWKITDRPEKTQQAVERFLDVA